MPTFITDNLVFHELHGIGKVIKVIRNIVTVEYEDPIEDNLFISVSNSSNLSLIA
ncbi:MAG: hypothetical protein QM500_19820 [Methylococcales bacterium]